MEPNIPTSFIPKKPVTSETVSSHVSPRAVGLLSILAFLVVLATVVSSLFVYIYQKQLISQRAKAALSINKARNNIGTDFITDMKKLNARIDGVKTILDQHIVVSPIFKSLEDTTLHSVQYKNFSYAFVTDQTKKGTSVEVTLTGNAKSYSTIALQSDAFTNAPLIKNPIFSSLNVNEKTNTVDFKLVFNVDPKDLSYQSFVSNKGETSANSNNEAKQ